MMPATTERHPAFNVRDAGRIGIVAGGGRLPVELATEIRGRGHEPHVVMIRGEADASLEAFDHVFLDIENFAALPSLLKAGGVTHAVLAGGIARRPRLSALRPSLALVALLPKALRALRRGDDTVLRVLLSVIESKGITMLGAHQIMPDLLAQRGPMSRVSPTKADWADLAAAASAARAIGALDIGQAAVAIGGRAIALEGVEGTDGLLERVRSLRSHGRLAGKARGVIVKCAKPGQDLRADLPAIGPATVIAAHAAGLAGIGIEAERSLVLDGAEVVAAADRLGLFVVGLPQGFDA